MGRVLNSFGTRLALAIAIGLGTVALVNGAASLAMQKPLNLYEEGWVFAFQVALVSIPFLVLALAGIERKGPWLTGLAMTWALWGFYFIDGLARRGDGTGANIGLGLLMVVSPLFITIACVVIAKRQPT